METQLIDSHTIDWSAPQAHLPFRTAAVLGAGTMGAQIAAHLANAGLQVVLLDIPPKDGGPGNKVVEKLFGQALKLKPDPLFTKDVANRIRLGNFDDDFGLVGEVEWVIEAVVERLDIKHQVMVRLEEAVGPNTIVSTNTSGLPISKIAEGRSEAFRKRFLGTHFFNPPRYLKLLELIPTPDTDPDVLARVAHFGRVRLGKGVVVAKDTPNFIGNRIGIYGMMGAIRAFTEGGYTIEEIDTLTGPLTGRPKSATFRTADVVGLDTLRHVAVNLYDNVPDDESRDAFVVPELLDRLVEQGALGAKTGAGFYQKDGKVIKSINPKTGAYDAPADLDLGDLKAIKKAGDLPDRLRALFADEGRAGAFFRASILDLIGYSARRVPEITDNPADIDRAMRWGFGWEMGPFETWDALGFETVLERAGEAGIAWPDWVRTMQQKGVTAFYRGVGSDREVYVPGREQYVVDAPPADAFSLAAIKTGDRPPLWEEDEAALLDLGEGVALYEFRSKANSLGFQVIQGLLEVIEKVEHDPNLRGLVIANEGKNFSVGANLGELAFAIAQKQFDMIEQAVRGFQEAVMRIRYAAKPVVVAPHQMTLGGACELTMASATPVVAAETYIGLVELGAGVIPAGTGTTHLAAQAAERAPSDFPSHIQPFIETYFETVAMAKVATSAHEGIRLGYLPAHTVVVMNAERRFHVARAEVIRLSEGGYAPPPVRTHIRVLGRPTHAALEVALNQYHAGRYISDYDRFLADRFAYVLTGGGLTGPQDVHEDYLLELEREVFLQLLGETKTQERITHILSTNKPLRN